MFELAVLLGLLVLAFPIIAIVALVKASGVAGRLDRLEERLATLERRPPAAAAAAAAVPIVTAPAPAAPPPVPSPAPATAEPQSQPVASEPPPPMAEPPADAPALSLPAPPPSPRSLEERFGTQWVVWVGGLALALGGIFLVRYSIEQGLLGPGVRIFLGALLATALIAAGEWTRRQEIVSGIAGVPSQHIPSILTAAGTVTAYATVYAAYALYDFLSPASAFVLLGIVALATLASALLHGPALAGLGLVGAFVTPALVSTDTPNYWALYIYLAVVSAAAFALARIRLWRWLAISAVALAVLWSLPGIDINLVDQLGAHLFHAVVGFTLAATLIVAGLLYGPPAEPAKIDEISSGALAAYLFAAMLFAIASRHDPAALTAFSVLAAAAVATAWRTTAALGAALAASAFAIIVMLEWAASAPGFEFTVMPPGPVQNAIPGPPGTPVGWHLAMGAFYAALFGAAGFFAQERTPDARLASLWSAASVLTPIAVLIALYYRLAHLDRSLPFAVLALALAAAFAYTTELLSKRSPRPGSGTSIAIYATGAVAALALTLTFALEKGWLTVGLALMVPGIAWIERERPLPALRWLAAAMVVLVLARIGYEPRIVGRDVGTTPIFNWLLYGYGVPAASFWFAGYLLRKRADDVPTRMTESAAILFTVLLAVLQIRHYINNGDVYRASAPLAEIALQVCVGLAMSIGLERVRLRSGSIVHDIGALAVFGLTLCAMAFGLLSGVNPLFTGRPVGGTFFNLVLLGYGIPAVLAGILALIARHTRPMPYRYVAAVTAIGLALIYLSLEVRTLFQGPVLTGAASDAEKYTYSAVWLAFGVVLLLCGVALRSQPARLASAAVIMLTVAKVFLVDMSGLTGIYRALSFIGLGIVLVGIGWLYQRVLFPRVAAPPAAPATPPV